MESTLGATEGASTRSHFITDIIDAHLEQGRYDRVVTRFPPEPNGYLHIGHAKSICLNFGLAQQYGGRCHMRFDDTNPETEDMEFVESIQRDVRWLGFEWGTHLYFASDYYERLYDVALSLVRSGKAYVCSLNEQEIREYRGTLNEPGRPSPFRERTVNENLDLLERMKAGEFPDGAHVLRARIDMAAANMKMRDPLLYRIRHSEHYRKGNQWCLYPMYDFAHCLSDAFEGITHSICTLEFENNRELYDWILENAGFSEPRPHQYEFARLNLTYTVMSKRKLLELVSSGRVSGWDDPRMPTLAGLRRRGVTPEAIRAFAELIGVSKANSTVDVEKLEFCIRDDLNARAPRAMAVLKPLEVVITNFPEGHEESIDAPSWPHDVPREGSRPVPFSRVIYIERDDFSTDPPPGFKRLVPGGEVRLRNAYVIRCNEIVTHPDTGELVRLLCTHDPATARGRAPEGRKVPGIIHWVSAATALRAEVRLYDRLFAVERPDADPRPYVELLNPQSLVVCEAALEPSLAGAEPGARFQFERLGYFYLDPEASTPSRPVYNRISGLKDSFARTLSAPEPAEPIALDIDAPVRDSRPRPTKRSRTELAERARAADAVLAERFAQWPQQFGLTADETDALTRERGLSDYFLSAANLGRATAKGLAAWILNDFVRETRQQGIEESPLSPTDFASLVDLVERGELTSALARAVLSFMVKEGGPPDVTIANHHLRPVADSDSIQALIDEALAGFPAEAARLRGGDNRLVGFFLGHIMRASKGKADAKIASELLKQSISAR